MDKLLEKYKLIDYHTTEVEIDKMEFLKRLRAVVDEGATGSIASPFEAFSSSDNDYIGRVEPEGFEFRRRRKMFQPNFNQAYVKGTFQQDRDRLIISSKIYGIGKALKFFLIVIAGFYLLFAAIILVVSTTDIDFPPYIILFLIPHALIMLCIPFFMAKYGARRMKKELEREFHYIAK
jgi:pilus assembly protein TadC